MDIDPELVAYLLTVILGVLATFFGEKWVKGRDFSLKISVALKELAVAIQDDAIDQAEAERIVASWKDVIDEATQLYTGMGSNKKHIEVASLNKMDSIEKKVDKILDKIR